MYIGGALERVVNSETQPARAVTVEESSSGESDDSEVIQYPFTKSCRVHRHVSKIMLKNLPEFQHLPDDARLAIRLR